MFTASGACSKQSKGVKNGVLANRALWWLEQKYRRCKYDMYYFTWDREYLSTLPKQAGLVQNGRGTSPVGDILSLHALVLAGCSPSSTDLLLCPKV